jgi:hypothetical protein
MTEFWKWIIWLNRPFWMDRHTMDSSGLVVRGIWRAKVEINTQVGHWHIGHLRLAKQCVRKRRKTSRWSVPSSSGLTIRQSSK